MKWFTLDIDKIVRWHLPIYLRRVKTILWLRALFTPFGQLVGSILYKMQHDCRVIYMEKMLNESFEMFGYSPQNHEATKVIYIGPGNLPEELYLFQDQEPDAPVWLDDDAPYMVTNAEYNAEYSDFIVVAPLSITSQESRMRRLIDYYKLAGKKYIIQYV